MGYSASIRENQLQVFWEIRTANVPNGTTLYWTLGLAEGGSPGVTPADFGLAQNWGTVIINDNFSNFTLRGVEDQVYEGPEFFILQLRTGSQYGPVIATSNYIQIVDTSTSVPVAPPYYPPPYYPPPPPPPPDTPPPPPYYPPPYYPPPETPPYYPPVPPPPPPPPPPPAPPAVAPTPTYRLSVSPVTVAEGGTLTYVLNGTNVVNGTYYWFVNHTETVPASFVSSSGAFAVTNNLGNFEVTASYDIPTTQAFTVSVYLTTTTTSSFNGLFQYSSPNVLATSDTCYVTQSGGGSGGGGGGFGGGGGSVAVNAYMPYTTKRAAEIAVGDPLLLLSIDRQGTMPGTTISNRISQQNLLTLISESGIRLTLSDNTPLTLPNGAYVNSTQALGNYLPVQDVNGFRWERIVEVVDAGQGLVATIACENQCYAAGDEPDRFIWTHNVMMQNYKY